MKINSIKFEMSIFYAVILGVILLIFSGALYFISNIFFRQIDNELKFKALEISQAIKSYEEIYTNDPNGFHLAVERTIQMTAEDPSKFQSNKLSQKWVRRSHELNLYKDYINFLPPGGESLYHSLEFDPELLSIFLQDAFIPNDTQMTFRSVSYQNKFIRLINYPFDTPAGRYVIQIGIAQEPVARLLQNWLYSVAISIPIILILTNFVGRILAGRILSPVYEITRMAQTITYQDLSLRIKSKQFDVEMNDLVEAFNNMISRLEKSFKHIEEFSSHVAHELKTPLTIIKGEAELAFKKERSLEEYKKVIKINQEEAERMLKTVEDLLLLTKLDYQPEVFKLEPIPSGEFFKNIYAKIKFLAAAKNIKIQFNAPADSLVLLADEVHLRRLFFNIIENAIKFTPVNSRVYIKVKHLNN